MNDKRGLNRKAKQKKKGEIKKMRSKKVWSILLVIMILSNFLSFLVPTNIEAAETTDNTIKVYITGKRIDNSVESSLLREMNRERLSGNNLKIDKMLRAAAYVRARELSVYYSNTRPNGKLSKSTGSSTNPLRYREYISQGPIAIDELSNPELYADYTSDSTKSIGHGNFTVGRTIL